MKIRNRPGNGFHMGNGRKNRVRKRVRAGDKEKIAVKIRKDNDKHWNRRRKTKVLSNNICLLLVFKEEEKLEYSRTIKEEEDREKVFYVGH